tara:strand:- start:6703 stop:6987 length:285 start_codon:yes stop_codon:yes gene_type:complete
MQDKNSQNKKEKDGNVNLTGTQLITFLIFFPIVIVWLFLAARIVWSASSNPETLDSIEGLLTALAVLSLPVAGGLSEILRAYASEISEKKKGDD